MDTITYKGKEYPIIEVEIKKYGVRQIATESLENVLLTEDGIYADDEARAIDESIFFFVEDEYIFKTPSEIAEIVYKATF